MNLVRWCEKNGTKVLQCCHPDGYWWDVDTVKDWMGETPTPPQPSEREKVVASLAHVLQSASMEYVPERQKLAETALQYLEQRLSNIGYSSCSDGCGYKLEALSDVRREVFGRE